MGAHDAALMKWVRTRQNTESVPNFKISKTNGARRGGPEGERITLKQVCWIDNFKTNPSSWNLIFEPLCCWYLIKGNSCKTFGSSPDPLCWFITPSSWSPQALKSLSRSTFRLRLQHSHSVLKNRVREHKNQRKQAHEIEPSATISIRYILSANEGQLPGKFFP